MNRLPRAVYPIPSGDKAESKEQDLAKSRRAGNSHGRENPQRGSRLEEATHVESILCNPAKGYGTALYGGICGHRDARRVQVRLLRAAVVSIRYQIPLGFRVAELLRAGE